MITCCHLCIERCIGCHSSCKRYIEESSNRRAMLDKQHEESGVNNFIISNIQRNKSKYGREQSLRIRRTMTAAGRMK